MPWFRVDDGFRNHPKTRSIPRGSRLAVIGVWTVCGNWCADQLTDGLISAENVLDEGGKLTQAKALVTAGLWHDHVSKCDHEDCSIPPKGSYQFHDWPVYQRMRVDVLAERAANAERMRKAREAKKTRNGATGVPPNVQAHTDRTFGERSDGVRVTPTRPDPVLNHHLQDLVCRRTFGDARELTDGQRADLWQVWSETAGPEVDLAEQLKAWIMHNAMTDLRNPAAALLGWLRLAAKHAATPPAPGCEKCIRGWLPDEHGQPSEHRCTTCRPHLRAVGDS